MKGKEKKMLFFLGPIVRINVNLGRGLTTNVADNAQKPAPSLRRAYIISSCFSSFQGPDMDYHPFELIILVSAHTRTTAEGSSVLAGGVQNGYWIRSLCP